MTTIYTVGAEPLSGAAFVPFGQVISRGDLVNVQGTDFANDNEVAYLERDLGVAVEAVL